MLRGGRLNGFQETQVVGILRNAAGALSDLTEGAVAGPFGGHLGSASGAENPEDGSWPLKNSEAKPGSKPDAEEEKTNEEKESPKDSAPSGKRKEKKEPAKKTEKKKGKKKDKNKEKPSKSRPAGREEVPERAPRKRAASEERGVRLREKTAEEIREEKSQPLPRGDRGARRGI